MALGGIHIGHAFWQWEFYKTSKVVQQAGAFTTRLPFTSTTFPGNDLPRAAPKARRAGMERQRQRMPQPEAQVGKGQNKKHEPWCLRRNAAIGSKNLVHHHLTTNARASHLTLIRKLWKPFCPGVFLNRLKDLDERHGMINFA